MLKRVFLLIIVLILSLFIVKTPSYSQSAPTDSSESDYDQIYSEYVNAIDEYKSAHKDYLLRRSQYIKFQSLKSKQDALGATLLMLEKRDDVVLAYLSLLKIKLELGVGITDERRNGLLSRISGEKDWFTDHKNNLTTTGSLEDLVEDSNLAADRWERVSPIAYEIMCVLSQGVITKYSGRLDDVFAETKEKLELIRSEERDEYILSSSKFDILDRWVFEADGKIVRSKEKQDDAEMIISELPKSKEVTDRVYNNVVEELTEARLYMNEAVSFIKEIVRQVKIAD